MSLEALEDRLLLDLNPLQVTTTFDDFSHPIPGNVTLRDAIGYADGHPGSAVSFQSNVTGTISLGGALPAISANMTIDGPGSSTLGVSASSALNPSGIFSINSGVTAAIYGLQIGGNVANFSGNGGAILNKGNLTLSLDVISGSQTTGNGGGIYNSSGAKLTLSGVSIGDNSAGLGGGLFNYGGTVTISVGSTIVGNKALGTAAAGGGIMNNYSWGSVTCNGGTEISGNTSDGSGGGVFNYGTFIMHGGQISDNHAQYGGGGVDNPGKMTLDQGVTLEGNGGYMGGAIFNNGQLVLSAVNIENGNKASYGAGMAMKGGTAYMIGGGITFNTASMNGGGIYVTAGKLTLDSGVMVANNYAQGGSGGGKGGGLYMNGGKVTVSGGSIQHNTAGNSGGGIYNNYGTLTLTDGVNINDNGATTEGGGVYLASGSTTTFDDATVSGNQTDGSQQTTGWGVYQQTTNATITPAPYNLTDDDDPGGKPYTGS